MIKFAAFIPHTPILIDQIGKENRKKLSKTINALDLLSKKLEEQEIDTIVTISAHNTSNDSAFAINLHDEYNVDFKDFGDLKTTKTFKPDLALITSIQRQMRNKSINFTLESSVSLDYGSAVPLMLLTKNINPKIVPITYSGLDKKSHIKFGNHLKELFINSKKNIAIIASGDLSHCLSSDAPMGFKKEGKKFDDSIKNAIKEVSVSKLLSINEEITENASECAYRPLLILFGITERMNIKPEILAYESPFGVGYLTANFHTQ